MASRTVIPDEDVQESQFIGKLVESLGSAAGGVFSSPWTGVPVLLLAIGAIDNGQFAPKDKNGNPQPGYYTAIFLTQLKNWITQIAQWIVNVVREVGGLPPENASGLYCVREVSVAGVESHKCYDTTQERDTALQILRQQDIFHLFSSIQPYDQKSGTTLYCVRYSGFLGLPGDQCFDTQAERDSFEQVGLATHRISNPVDYQKVIP